MKCLITRQQKWAFGYFYVDELSKKVSWNKDCRSYFKRHIIVNINTGGLIHFTLKIGIYS
jgi:hypothetical protein